MITFKKNVIMSYRKMLIFTTQAHKHFSFVLEALQKIDCNQLNFRPVQHIC